jgi:hypothetical protein
MVAACACIDQQTIGVRIVYAVTAPSYTKMRKNQRKILPLALSRRQTGKDKHTHVRRHM